VKSRRFFVEEKAVDTLESGPCYYSGVALCREMVFEGVPQI